MLCKKCNNVLAFDETVCPTCGTPVEVAPQAPKPPQKSVITNEPPIYRPDPVKYEAPLSMSWYNFETYFAMPANVVLNIISAVLLLFGFSYLGYRDLVYTRYPILQAIDLFSAFLTLCLVVYFVFTFRALTRKKRIGPTLLCGIYFIDIFYSLFTAISSHLIITDRVFVVDGFELTITRTNILSTVLIVLIDLVFLLINYIYFKNRSHIFVN